MRSVFLFALAVNMMSPQISTAQGVSFGGNRHLSKNDKITIIVSVPFDTTEHQSGTVNFGVFNDRYTKGARRFKKRDSATGWCDPALEKDIYIRNGIQAFFIKFPDGFIRAYSCLVSSKIVPSSRNLLERTRIPVKKDEYDDLYNFLESKMASTSDSALLKELPAGLKAFACFDFWKIPNGEEDDRSTICMVSQYLLGTPPDMENKTNFFFRDFIKCEKDSPLYTLLNGSWQMNAGSFNKDDLPSHDDIFDSSQYKPIRHPNSTIDGKISIQYIKDDAFRRIVIFIDN